MSRLKVAVALAVSIALLIVVLQPVAADKSFRYSFDVDEEGCTNVTIVFTDTESGSSWLLVPKSEIDELHIYTWSGEVLSVEYEDFIEGGEENPFYYVMRFSYKADDIFNMTLTYPMPYGALVMEPNAIFISPRVTHENTGYTRTITRLPVTATTSEDRVTSFSGIISDVSVEKSKQGVLVEASISSDDRVVVEYDVPPDGGEEVLQVENFVFEVPSRYVDYAVKVLDTLNESYPLFRDIFGVDLEHVEVRFFVPSIEDLRAGLEGYVPFEGEQLGAIHLNLLYIRGVEGFLEVIALHELTHHFLWAIGVPPAHLWIHEGAAEYMSLTVGRMLGFEKAVDMHEQSLVELAGSLQGNIGFVQEWTPFYTPPQGLRLCYSASYYVFKYFGDRYGGLEFLKKLFHHLSGVEWSNDTAVFEAFGLAAGDVDGVLNMFREWGFTFRDKLALTSLVLRAKSDAEAMPTWLEPYKAISSLTAKLAELLYYSNATGLSMLISALSLALSSTSPYLMGISIVVVVVALIATYSSYRSDRRR